MLPIDATLSIYYLAVPLVMLLPMHCMQDWFESVVNYWVDTTPQCDGLWPIHMITNLLGVRHGTGLGSIMTLPAHGSEAAMAAM